MDQRRKLKPSKKKSNEHLDKYKQVSSTLQRQLRLDKEKWIQDRCSEAEEGLKKNDTRATYKIKKQLTNHFRPSQRNIMDKENRKECNQLEDIHRRWKEYGEGLFKSNDIKTRVGKNSRNPLEILRSEVRAAIK